MTSPLDGNGVAAAEAAFNASINNPQMVPCSKCEGRGFHHGFGEDGNDPDWCTECGGNQFNVVPGEETRAIEAAVAAYLAAAAPSHTAVEPVAWLTEWKRDGEEWVNAHANEVTALDEARAYGAAITPLVPLSALTAQAAALVAAERERDEALAEAKKWWLSDCRSLTERNEARAEVATLKARVAELEAGLAALLSVAEGAAEMASERSDWEQVAYRYGDAVLTARRLTHQEKNNG